MRPISARRCPRISSAANRRRVHCRWNHPTSTGRTRSSCGSRIPRSGSTSDRWRSPAANRDVTFDSRVLATGNEPATLPVPGGDHPRLLRLRFLRQARILRRAAGQARSAVIVGSGLIGCEVAASLAARGLHVAVLSMEELPQIGRLGRAAAERIAGRSRPAEHLFEKLPRTAIVD